MWLLSHGSAALWRHAGCPVPVEKGCSMNAGSKAVADALVPALGELGWASRARGWFTKALNPDAVGVLALDAATRSGAAGSALVTLNVGIRLESVELVVKQLVGAGGSGYRTRTATSPLGYLTPRRARSDLVATSDSAV